MSLHNHYRVPIIYGMRQDSRRVRLSQVGDFLEDGLRLNVNPFDSVSFESGVSIIRVPD